MIYTYLEIEVKHSAPSLHALSIIYGYGMHGNGSTEQYNTCGMGAPTTTTTNSTSIVPPPGRRGHRRIRWRTKHYLSVAMVGSLVVIGLVAGMSISLAPAQLTFSIVKANVALYGTVVAGDNSSSSYRNLNHSSNTHLNFTLEVCNSSPRTAVRYRSMSGEISYGPAATAWVRCSNQSEVSQEPLSAVNINFSADYGYNENTPEAVDNCRILMVSKVRFAWLGLGLPYTVRFSCEAVNFKDSTNFPIRCA